MDIQKEGELFEIWWENHGQYNRAGGGNYEKTFAWESWIAAKAQAVPEGFVLVPKEPNLEFKDRLRSYLDNLWMGEWGCDWDGFICVNGIDPNHVWKIVTDTKVMIEPQEPTND